MHSDHNSVDFAARSNTSALTRTEMAILQKKIDNPRNLNSSPYASRSHLHLNPMLDLSTRLRSSSNCKSTSQPNMKPSDLQKEIAKQFIIQNFGYDIGELSERSVKHPEPKLEGPSELCAPET